MSRKEEVLNYLSKSKSFNRFLDGIPENDEDFLSNLSWDFEYTKPRPKIRKGELVKDGTGLTRELFYDNTNWEARERIEERNKDKEFVMEEKGGIKEYYYDD